MYVLTVSAILWALARARAVVEIGELTQLPCPYLYEFANGNCYRVVKEAKTHAQAQAFCEETGGTLASPNSEDEFKTITELIRRDPSADPAAFWLGYTDEKYEGIFVDGDDKVLTHHPRFKPGEPNNCCGGEQCLEIYRNDGRMNDRACNSKTASVCSACPQGEAGCRCPAQWTEYEGNCYRFFGRPRTFEEAEAKCNSFDQSAHLTSVHSKNENDFITDFIGKSMPGNDLTRTWIGFNDKAKENAFKWTDGSSNDYRKWYSGEPNNLHGKEDCTLINHKGQAGKWNDTPCSGKLAAVCKMAVIDANGPCYKLAEIIEQLTGKCEAAHR